MHQNRLSWRNFGLFVVAMHAKGSLLDNCRAFPDGTRRSVCFPRENKRVLYSGYLVRSLYWISISCCTQLDHGKFVWISQKKVLWQCRISRFSCTKRTWATFFWDCYGNFMHFRGISISTKVSSTVIIWRCLCNTKWRPTELEDEFSEGSSEGGIWWH